MNRLVVILGGLLLCAMSTGCNHITNSYISQLRDAKATEIPVPSGEVLEGAIFIAWDGYGPSFSVNQVFLDGKEIKHPPVLVKDPVAYWTRDGEVRLPLYHSDGFDPALPKHYIKVIGSFGTVQERLIGIATIPAEIRLSISHSTVWRHAVHDSGCDFWFTYCCLFGWVWFNTH